MTRALRSYTTAIGEEPLLRAYLVGSLVDDIGVAASTWGMSLLQTDLFTDQHERAKLLIPTMLCFLAGTVISGPLADWARHDTPAALARWRWRLVVWARVIETAALGLLMFAVTGGTPTIQRVMPYFFVSAFMKTALRPTRNAFEVDLLRREEVQIDASGAPLLDERGMPLVYKLHLLSFGAMTSFLRTGARFGGLLVGGRILAATHGHYLPLLAFDVFTNFGFILVVLFRCHPERGERPIRLRELFGEAEAPSAGVRASAIAARQSLVVAGLREFAVSIRDAVRFLARPAQRQLCWLLLGAWVLEVINEFYDGGMIVRHVLHGTAENVRHGQVAWTATSVITLALVPLLARRVSQIGKIFLFTMALDGVMIVLLGRVSAAGTAVAITPFVAILCADHALTNTSGAVIDLAKNSASSALIRGRISAAYALVVIVSDLFAEGAATALSDRVGISGMLLRIGLAQVGVVLLVALVGGRALWRYGLRSVDRNSVVPETPEVRAA